MTITNVERRKLPPNQSERGGAARPSTAGKDKGGAGRASVCSALGAGGFDGRLDVSHVLVTMNDTVASVVFHRLVMSNNLVAADLVGRRRCSALRCGIIRCRLILGSRWDSERQCCE